MQNIETFSDNPLKPRQVITNPKETDQSKNTQTKPKFNKKLLLILIPIILGILSLLVSNITRKDSANTTNTNQTLPTVPTQTNITNTPSGNKWQQQLNNIDQEINQNQEILPPKIDQKITF